MSNIIGVGNTHELDLGIVVKYVLNGVSQYLKQADYIGQLKNKLESIPAMTTDEVKQVLCSFCIVESLWSNEKY